MTEVQTLTLEEGAAVSYLGKKIHPEHRDPLPALFYFALSGDESLSLDPYNQPAAFLKNHSMRIFSLTLPFHGAGSSPLEALSFWASELSRGHDLIEEFVQTVKRVFEQLVQIGAIDPNHVGVSGLSRGAFIACHVAAKIPEMKTILGFAPLTELSYAKEFHNVQDLPIVKNLGLHTLIQALVGRTLRFYIGNLDTRVSTPLCFQFIESLCKASHKQGVRSPQVELLIGPSIGHQGHGTSKEIFENGATWMAGKLGVPNE